jgi:phosphoglycerate dehydrogenase-like enzyme
MLRDSLQGMTILDIWCNHRLADPERRLLASGVAPHRLTLTDPADDAVAADASVAFGQPNADRCAALARLGWIQVASAGYTAFDRTPIRAALAARGAALTNSSSVYADPCAQHVLAFMLADTRQLPRALAHQLGDRAWDHRATRAASRRLGGQSVVLVGFGAIARRLVELLAPFGLDLVGVRGAARGDEPVPIVPLAELDAHLARADHVVSTLPANASTLRFFGAERLAAIRPGAVFHNIGRGTTVDQAALGAALRSGKLRAAYLDVTDPEPLPPDDPLWSIPSCVITPHTAGGHADEPQRLVRHFLDNLARYTTGAPLADRVI